MERYRKTISKYYKSSCGALVVFDVTSRQSFENIPKWITELQNMSEAGLCIIIVGNKTDLKEQRVVTKEEAEKYAKANGFQYIETSALIDDGIKEGFISLTNEMYTLGYENNDYEGERPNVQINNDDQNDDNAKKSANTPSNSKQANVGGCGCMFM